MLKIKPNCTNTLKSTKGYQMINLIHPTKDQKERLLMLAQKKLQSASLEKSPELQSKNRAGLKFTEVTDLNKNQDQSHLILPDKKDKFSWANLIQRDKSESPKSKKLKRVPNSQKGIKLNIWSSSISIMRSFTQNTQNGNLIKFQLSSNCCGEKSLSVLNQKDLI